MKQELYLNNYLVELFNNKINNGFENYYNFVMSFNTKIGEYGMPIDKYIKPIYEYNLIKLKESKIKYSTKEFKKSFRTNILFENKNYPTSEAIIHVPVYYNNIEKINKILIDFIIKNKINCNIKLFKYNQNNIYNIKCFELSDAKKILSYYDSDLTLIKEIKNKLSPFILQINEIGVSTESKSFNYLYEISKISYSYLSTKKKKEKIKYDDFVNYISELCIKETNILKKENYNYVLRIVKKMKDKDKIEDIFNYNAEMNLGSIDPNEYSLRLDSDNKLIFEQKEGNLQIKFGSEDYLNLSYSKVYRNIIEKSENLKFYNYFNNIYHILFLNHYSGIETLFNFENLNSNVINQQLMMNACAYFGLIKFAISLDDTNKILSIAYKKNLNIELELKENIFDEIKKEKKYSFPFSIEYGNKIIDMPNGEKTSIYTYYNDNNVLSYVNEDTIITLKDGSVMSGEEFLKYSEQFFNNYNSFKEIVNKYIEFIEFK